MLPRYRVSLSVALALAAVLPVKTETVRSRGQSPAGHDALAASAKTELHSSTLDSITHYRGVAVLASEIGKGTKVEEILDLTRTCRLNLVIIDFAWITHHWPTADQAAIRRLCDDLRKRGVQVAVMYRPRALRPAEAPIHYARDEQGRIAESHNELCLAHKDSVDWATQWGTRIRKAFPAVDKIIIYNLRNACHCPECQDGKGTTHAGDFLTTCRREWRRQATTLQIGHVGVANEYLDEVDFLCPFLAVNRTGDSPPDFDGDVARLVELGASAGGKPVIPLLKTCWEQQTKNTSADVAQAIKACDKAGIGFILWYYEWIFHSTDGRYDPKVVTAAMKGESEKSPAAPATRPASGASNRATDTGKGHAVDPALKVILERCRTDREAFGEAKAMGEAAVDGLARILLDNKLDVLNRCSAANVLGDIGSRQSVKPLLEALKDPEQTVRRCAATALGKIGDPSARPALERLARQDPFSWYNPATRKTQYLVREDARQALAQLAGKAAVTSPRVAKAPSTPALKIPETQPSCERLPWPHQAPDLSPAEVQKLNEDVWIINDFSLYQADEKGDFAYLHGGFDIVLENGTRIYAMKDGWVKSTANSTVAIADNRDERPCYGWEYTHLGNVKVKVGQSVKRGTLIGEVQFHGLAHVHLTKVYSQAGRWGSWRFMCMPNGHFEYADTQPPVIATPFHFLQNKTDATIQPDSTGTVVLSGKVDIAVGMREQGEYAHAKDGGFGDRLGISRIEWKVRPTPQANGATRKFKSFDFEHMIVKCAVDDRAFNALTAKTVCQHWTSFEAQRPSGNKTLCYYVITNCPQTGDCRELRPEWADGCWDTTVADADGRPMFPNGKYELAVRAWDFKGQEAEAAMEILIQNK